MATLEQLGLNWQGLLAQIINVGILLAILVIVLYKPIVRMLDNRAAKIAQGLEQAEEMKIAAQRSKEESAAIIEQSRKDAQAIIARAEQSAIRIKEEAMANASKEAAQFLERARAEIELDKQRAISQIRSELADLAILAASRVVGQNLDKNTNYQIIKEVLDEAAKKN